jgi:hypothetical protein
MDVNQERAMRLIVALLKVFGPFEISKSIIEDPDAFAGMVVYVEPSMAGDEETFKFSVKRHNELKVDKQSEGPVQ